MSVHSEVQNLYRNKSGNAALSIHSRSGDTEEGAEYFDLRASTAPNALEVLEQTDSQTARKKFLCAYFTLLKERLNRFEFEYVKQLYAEGQAESVICDNLGLNPRKFKRGLQKKLTASAADISALVEASDWDDAELFAHCFLSAPQDIQDANEAAYLPKTVKGFGNLIERLAYRRYRKIYKAEWYKRRPNYNRTPLSYFKSVSFRFNVGKRLKVLLQLFRTFSYEFMFNSLAFDCMGLAPANAEKLPLFEQSYRVFYNSFMESLQELCKIVEGVPIAEAEQPETEEHEEVKDCEENTAKACV